MGGEEIIRQNGKTGIIPGGEMALFGATPQDDCGCCGDPGGDPCDDPTPPESFLVYPHFRLKAFTPRSHGGASWDFGFPWKGDEVELPLTSFYNGANDTFSPVEWHESTWNGDWTLPIQGLNNGVHYSCTDESGAPSHTVFSCGDFNTFNAYRGGQLFPLLAWNSRSQHITGNPGFNWAKATVIQEAGAILDTIPTLPQIDGGNNAPCCQWYCGVPPGRICHPPIIRVSFELGGTTYRIESICSAWVESLFPNNFDVTAWTFRRQEAQFSDGGIVPDGFTLFPALDPITVNFPGQGGVDIGSHFKPGGGYFFTFSQGGAAGTSRSFGNYIKDVIGLSDTQGAPELDSDDIPFSVIFEVVTMVGDVVTGSDEMTVEVEYIGDVT